ncbi:MAG: Holliday junction resolvase, partial [Pseudomonadota bacterium]
PLHLEDERYSSLEAAQQLRERRESGRQRGRIERGQIDSAAAAVILERWLTQAP